MIRLRPLLDLVNPGRTYRYGDDHALPARRAAPPAGRGPHPVVVTIHGGSWSVGWSQAVHARARRRARAPRLRRLEHRVPPARRRRGRRLAGDVPRRRRRDRPSGASCRRRSTSARHLLRPFRGRPARAVGGEPRAAAARRARRRSRGSSRSPRSPPPASTTSRRATARCPDGVVGRLMGGGPDDVPDRYAIADPIALVPLAIPVLLVHGTEDETVSVRRSRNYAQAARALGADVELVEIPGAAGTHRSHVFPWSAGFAAVLRWLERAPARRAARSSAHRLGAHQQPARPSSTLSPTLLTSGFAAVDGHLLGRERDAQRLRRGARRAPARATPARRPVRRGSPACGRARRPRARWRRSSGSSPTRSARRRAIPASTDPRTRTARRRRA